MLRTLQRKWNSIICIAYYEFLIVLQPWPILSLLIKSPATHQKGFFMFTALQVVKFIFQADPRFVWNRNLLEELIETKVILFERNTSFSDSPFQIYLPLLYVILQLDEFITPLIQGNILKFQEISWQYNTVLIMLTLVVCMVYLPSAIGISMVSRRSWLLFPLHNCTMLFPQLLEENMLQELVHPWLFYVFRQSNLPWRMDQSE